MRPNWDALAAQLGPQTAEYMHDGEWAGTLRSVACKCGAIIEILADEPGDGHECGHCAIERAELLDEGYRAWRAALNTKSKS